MNTTPSKNKDRSPNFPFITLEVALERAQQFYAKEKRGAAPFAVTASHWRYSSSSSGAMQTVAALKSYGLMSDEGSGPKRLLRLTDLALHIILDQRPGSFERASYIAEAAKSPPVASDVYEKFGNELPSQANLRHYLVLDRSFNEANSHKVVKILFDNHMFAGLSSSEGEVSAAEPREDVMEPSLMPVRSDYERTPIRAPSAAGTLPPQSVAESERVIAPDATVHMHFSATPTWETYDFLEAYMKLRKSVLVKKAPN